jgi:hypothetical protein
MDYFRYIMEVVGTGVDGLRVFVIIGGALLGTVGPPTFFCSSSSTCLAPSETGVL